MRSILTIAWRDFYSLVTSPIFFLVAFFCSLIWSFAYTQILYQFDQLLSQPLQLGGIARSKNIHLNVFGHYLASSVNLVMLIAIPAVTMKLLSEEKKQRTYDLLLTAPISATQIALGKYLAGLLATAVLLGISLLFPLMTSLFMSFPKGPLVSALLGFSLLLGAYVAIGLFASSLSASAMLSVVIGVSLNLAILVIPSASESIDHPLVMSLINHISIVQQLQSFLLGHLKTHSVVFFLSLTSFFVFLTQRVIESSRWR